MNRLKFERQLWNEGYTRIMGLDEVGRGCLSGPVVAAGVIFPGTVEGAGIRDSKQLSLERRLQLQQKIKEEALFWTIQQCSPAEIDTHNILQASLRAMQKCVSHKQATPDYLLVDGNKYLPTLRPHKCIVKGDDKSMSIAAASILAKVHRDTYMKKLHQQFPYYGWNTNVGYPTKAHYQGLESHGITPHHRKSFSLRTSKIYASEDNKITPNN